MLRSGIWTTSLSLLVLLRKYHPSSRLSTRMTTIPGMCLSFCTMLLDLKLLKNMGLSHLFLFSQPLSKDIITIAQVNRDGHQGRGQSWPLFPDHFIYEAGKSWRDHFFCLLSFVFLGRQLRHMEVPRLGVQLELQLLAYATAHGNAGPLTHSARPGIKPTSSWILVGFVNRWARNSEEFIF